MRIGKFQFKRRVLVGLACVLTATGVWWAWTRSRVPLVAVAGTTKAPFVRLTGVGGGTEDQVLRERGEYFDPTPLFFPTERNYGQKGLPASLRRQPGQVFGSFDAKFTFQDRGIQPYGVEAQGPSEQLVDVLNQGNGAPFAGMGQNDVYRTPLTERAGFLEIRTMKDGNIVVAQDIKGISLPQSDFRPLEFIATVSSAGLICEPVLVAGSGRDEVDAFLRAYLVKSFRLGERLSPGLYRVLVGP